MSELHVYPNIEQRSAEWYSKRCGIVTASSVGDLISVGAPNALEVDCPSCGALAGEPCLSAARKAPTPIKTIHGERTDQAATLPPVYAPADNDTSRGLLDVLAAERITGHVEETFTSHDMRRGIFAEPFARDLYGGHHAAVTECGFMVRDFGGFRIGYSPDGLVGDDGLIEIKAPRQKRHLRTVLDGQVPTDNMAQIQTGFVVSGRAWLDFVPYCGGMALWVKRVYPDPAWQAAIVAVAQRAETAIAERVAAYRDAVAGLPITKRIDFDLEVV